MSRPDEMAAQLRRMARNSWEVGDECAKRADAMAPDPEIGKGLRPEGDFEIAVSVLGRPTGRTVMVHAHNLVEALHKAATTPFADWWDDDEEDEQ